MYDRGEATLYERLRAMRERPLFGTVYARLRDLQAQVDFLPPFEFYVRLLGMAAAAGACSPGSGPAAAEPIEAFLAQALAFEQSHPPSMQAFLHWLRADTTELIRDPDRPRDDVRVLTWPRAPRGWKRRSSSSPMPPSCRTGDRLLWTEPDGLPLWRVGSQLRDRLSDAADRRAALAQQQEQRRLLYVALTRAQERLIVAGWQRKNQATPTWYD